MEGQTESAAAMSADDLSRPGSDSQIEVGAAAGRGIARLMQPAPATTCAGDYLLDAAARMRERRVRHLPVIDGERRVIGMLSDRDVRSAIGDPRRALDDRRVQLRVHALRVADVMTAPAITVPRTATIGEVARLLVARRFGAIPVADEQAVLIGIVSYVDLLQVLAEQSAAPAMA